MNRLFSLVDNDPVWQLRKKMFHENVTISGVISENYLMRISLADFPAGMKGITCSVYGTMTLSR